MIGDLGVADLDGVVEELHDDHVLAFRGDLDDAVRFGGRQAFVVHQPERVILVLDEPTHGPERRLVLERAVQDRASKLVPPVGSNVVLGVELGEHIAVRLVIGVATVMRRGVEPPDPSRPTGLIRSRRDRAGPSRRERSPRLAPRRRPGARTSLAGTSRGTRRWV